MAVPRPRLDGYATPVPSPADATEERLHQRPTNQRQLHYVGTCLYAHLETLLQRGVHADVTVTLSIQDGIIQERIGIGTVRWYRPEER